MQVHPMKKASFFPEVFLRVIPHPMPRVTKLDTRRTHILQPARHGRPREAAPSGSYTSTEAVESPRPMPDALTALVAFVAEHRRCGDLDGDGGKDNGHVWISCSCGRRIAQPERKPPSAARTEA